MLRLQVIVLLVIAILGVAGISSAQERRVGLGVEAENVSFVFVEDETVFQLRTLTTTPSFVFSLRATPNWFIEPSFGVFTSKGEETRTFDFVDSSGNLTVGTETSESRFRDIKIGLGGLYMFAPEAFTSAYVHGKFDVHFLNAKGESSTQAPGFEPFSTEEEISSTAFAVAGALGGIMNVKERVFLTLEARLLYARQGDPETKRTSTPPSPEPFVDRQETKAWAITTDMVLGLRLMF